MSYPFRPPMFPAIAYHNKTKEEQYIHNAASVIQEWYLDRMYEFDEDQFCWRQYQCRFFCICPYVDSPKRTTTKHETTSCHV